MDTTEVLQLIRELRSMGAVSVDVSSDEAGVKVRVLWTSAPSEAPAVPVPVEIQPMNASVTSPSLWGRMGSPPRFPAGRVVPTSATSLNADE